MDSKQIRDRIVDIVAAVTNIDPGEIADDASFVDDLGLDSLVMLEIGVDVDYAFKLGLAEERLGELRNVADAVALVEQCLAERDARQEVA